MTIGMLYIACKPYLLDWRIALMKISRFNLHAAALFPDIKPFRELALREMKEMVAKFPRGFDDYNEK